MPKLHDLNLRVNGVPCSKVTLRLAIEDGFPGGSPEIVMNDPMLGDMTITEDCDVEMQVGNGPWNTVTLTELTHAVQKARQ
jgi:hypothetical protein